MDLSFLFPLVFFLGLFGFNYYVVRSFLKLFDFKVKLRLWAVTLGLFLFFISLMVLSFFLRLEFVGEVVFYFEVLVFVLFFVFLVLDLIGLVYKFEKKFKLVFVVLFVLIYFGYGFYNAGQVYVNEVDIESEKVNSSLKIVQISDIHTGSTSPEFLREVIVKVNSLSPDVVVITGDLVDSISANGDDFDALYGLNAPAYFIFGNHEIYSRKDAEFFEQFDLNVLENSEDVFGDVQFVGVNLYGRDGLEHRGPSDLEPVLEEIFINTSKYVILLNHEPLDADVAFEEGVDLMLSGHTHKGQIFPFELFVRLRYKYVYGLYEEDEGSVYVTSGTGVWGPLVRVGSRNEIVVFNIS